MNFTINIILRQTSKTSKNKKASLISLKMFFYTVKVTHD